MKPKDRTDGRKAPVKKTTTKKVVAKKTETKQFHAWQEFYLFLSCRATIKEEILIKKGNKRYG